jgi:hypothetical protein
MYLIWKLFLIQDIAGKFLTIIPLFSTLNGCAWRIHTALHAQWLCLEDTYRSPRSMVVLGGYIPLFFCTWRTVWGERTSLAFLDLLALLSPLEALTSWVATVSTILHLDEAVHVLLRIVARHRPLCVHFWVEDESSLRQLKKIMLTFVRPSWSRSPCEQVKLNYYKDDPLADYWFLKLSGSINTFRCIYLLMTRTVVQ